MKKIKILININILTIAVLTTNTIIIPHQIYGSNLRITTHVIK